MLVRFNNDDGQIQAQIEGNNVRRYLTSTTNLVVGTNYFIEILWDFDNDNYYLLINGVIEASSTLEITWAGSTSGVLRLGATATDLTHSCDCFVHNFTITSNPNTPQLWTANGKPLILTDFKSEVS